MQRIQGATATIDNLFTEGNPSLNIPATIVSSNFMNGVQEEVAQSVERGVLTLDQAKQNQLGDFITESSRPFNLMIGFGVGVGAGPNNIFLPAVNLDLIGVNWAFYNGTADGSPNPLNPNIWVNNDSSCLEVEGTGVIGDYFLIKNADTRTQNWGDNKQAFSANNVRGSQSILPSNAMTKSFICTGYGGSVPVEISVEVLGGAPIYKKTEIVNNGETKQAITIQKDSTSFGNFDLKIKLMQTGTFKINLGGFCAMWGVNKKPPFTLASSFGADQITASYFYQTGRQGAHFGPCLLNAGVGATSLYEGFCAFSSETNAQGTIQISNLVVSAYNHGSITVTPNPLATIEILAVYKNGFEYRVSNGEAASRDFLSIAFNWSVWRI